MKRIVIVFLTLALAGTLLPATDDPATDKLEPARLKKKDKAGPGGDALTKPEEGDQGDKAKELLARVAKNMGTSEDRLKNRDPGEKTQKIQDQIVKDLDELIKKSQEQDDKDSSSQQSSSSQSSSSKSGSTQGSKSQSRRGSKKNGGQQKQKAGQDIKEQNAGNKKDGPKKDDPSAASNKQQGKDKQGKDSSASASGGGGNSSAQKKNTVADLFRDVWGHLPENKRQEMDAYSRERFMPRYDELLRQYYRTLSEQNRKKDGD